MGWVGLERGEEEGVSSEGVDVVEALGNALYIIEAVGVGLVDDGVLPPGLALMPEPTQPGWARVWERAEAERQRVRRKARWEGMGRLRSPSC